MATFNSLFGPISIYKNKNGKTIIRRKPNISKKVKTHPNYIRTRENAAAFGKASSAGRMIRRVLHPWVDKINDSRTTNRLVKLLMVVIRGGNYRRSMNPQVADGSLQALRDFQFNPKISINNAFIRPYTIELADNNKQVVIEIPAFIPTESVFNSSARFTHFKLIPIVAAFNFESGNCKLLAEVPENPLPYNGKKTKPIRLTADIEVEGNVIIIIALAVEFYQAQHQNYYAAIASGGQDALGIIEVIKSE
jgi:hypothetical protein